MQNNVAFEPEWVSQRINLDSKVDCEFWCKMLQCKESDLRRAIRIIGNSARLVKTYLELNRQVNSF